MLTIGREFETASRTRLQTRSEDNTLNEHLTALLQKHFVRCWRSVDAVLSMFTNFFVRGYSAKLIEISMLTLLSAILKSYERALNYPIEWNPTLFPSVSIKSAIKPLPPIAVFGRMTFPPALSTLPSGTERSLPPSR
jgi:hypothetical protein